MKIIELVLDDDKDGVFGIDAISLVDKPAIKENFVAFSEGKELVRFATADKEQRILLGAALIPNMPIYREDDKHGEYYVFMSKGTVLESAKRYLRQGVQKSTTLQHSVDVDGCCVVESWVKMSDKDKSNHYGMNVPVGTWLVAMEVSEEIWNDYVKTGEVKGFSIEAGYANRMQMQQSSQEDKFLKEVSELFEKESNS